MACAEAHIDWKHANTDMVQYIRTSFPDATLAGYSLPGWYFWDETQAHCYGPYESKTRAQSELTRYAVLLAERRDRR